MNSTQYRSAVFFKFLKYVSFGAVHQELIFSEKGTRILIDALLENREIHS